MLCEHLSCNIVWVIRDLKYRRSRRNDAISSAIRNLSDSARLSRESLRYLRGRLAPERSGELESTRRCWGEKAWWAARLKGASVSDNGKSMRRVIGSWIGRCGSRKPRPEREPEELFAQSAPRDARGGDGSAYELGFDEGISSVFGSGVDIS